MNWLRLVDWEIGHARYGRRSPCHAHDRHYPGESDPAALHFRPVCRSPSVPLATGLGSTMRCPWAIQSGPRFSRSVYGRRSPGRCHAHDRHYPGESDPAAVHLSITTPRRPMLGRGAPGGAAKRQRSPTPPRRSGDSPRKSAVLVWPGAIKCHTIQGDISYWNMAWRWWCQCIHACMYYGMYTYVA